MINKKIDVSILRREYTSGKLCYSDLTVEPMELFSIWLKQAYLAKLPDATAMCIATVDNTGQPYQRIVLMKQFSNQNIVFYTNMKSRKAKQLADNPRISLHFSWCALERQVMMLGKVQKLPFSEIFKYFHSRPKNSKIAAWASHQSTIISNRSIITNKFSKFKKYFLHNKVPLPGFWGGYKVNIDTVEFWQGRKYRLHDRFIYKRKKNHSWHIHRLSP